MGALAKIGHAVKFAFWGIIWNEINIVGLRILLIYHLIITYKV